MSRIKSFPLLVGPYLPVLLAMMLCSLLLLPSCGGRGLADDRGGRDVAAGGEVDPENSYRIGMAHALEGEYDAALPWLQQAVAEGQLEALYALAWFYLEGYAVPADPAEAARLLGVAARQGNLESQYMLAVLYGQGRGVEKNSGASLQWMQRAARGGHPEARRVLQNLFK